MTDLLFLAAHVELMKFGNRDVDGDAAELLGLPPEGYSREQGRFSRNGWFHPTKRKWHAPHLTSDPAATLSVFEELLPGWNFTSHCFGMEYDVCMWAQGSRRFYGATSGGPLADRTARAQLAALLRVMADREREKV